MWTDTAFCKANTKPDVSLTEARDAALAQYISAPKTNAVGMVLLVLT